MSSWLGQSNPVQPVDPDKAKELAEALELAKVAPSSFSEVVDTVMVSLTSIWEGFLGHIPFFIASVLMLVLTWGMATFAGKFARRFARKTTPKPSLQDLIVRLTRIFIWLLGLLFTAMVLFPGLTPARALGGLGLLSVAVGFAFKDIFENFFAGILILWRFPFEAGDVIKCENVEGRVEAVEVRNTTIRRTTGELVIVPNLFLFKNPCEILTDRNKRRITIIAGVAYGEDVVTAVEVINAAVGKCETVRDDEPIQIFPQGFGDSSIDIEVTWWAGSTPLEERRSRGEVVTAVKRALDEAGIEIPFPYRTLTFKEPLSLASRSDEAPERDV
ncbi:mechanosensitive ion channel family protein [Microbulbifer hydrolyticus]|uniref:Small-conductance mechanosensitive channel n=1 Tax=Microbulbifer hydrolyticus TaxID=48074 RepID=A0A6P1TCD1_9GAMM|nr:mechanosensitive ion channel family protein [Microbulbifer hydrolyticus]MBB5210207.1 small-conductance mechanosensitive channel [Microbulbifer hydrolyticus]QHQ39286.1 mechanosensitive ion channel [Microbulbifer hydrolyticus]